ncbi:MAG: hypothetical protein LQ337_007425 [Flavoplaca oasis]|nr:MAG: hypothetical protein LQ337_007425 [Flavoplaca oasis]
MAQIQLRAQKRKFNRPAVETIQSIELQQSFSMIYILLHSSLAQITYLRHLFPNGCFKDSSFDAIRKDAENHYRHYLSDQSAMKKQRAPSDHVNPTSSSLTLKLLVQSSHVGATMFHRWLNGILQGVFKRTATAAQFCICGDPTNRSNVLESYTFRFHYGGSQPLADLAVSGSSSSLTIISSAKFGLEKLFEGISSSIEQMPDLPGKPAMFSIAQYFDTKDIRVGEDRVDPEDLYGIPERLQHSRIVSRVVDTPKDRTSTHRYNDSRQRDTSKQAHQRHLSRSEGRLHVSQSPLDIVTANTSKVIAFPGTSPSTVISHLSEPCSHISQSIPDELVGTQKLPAAETPHRCVRLSKHSVQRLQERGAPSWKVTDNKEHVHCQCNFNKKEGNMLRQLKDLVLVRRCLWILYGPNPPSTQAQLKRRLEIKDEDDVAKLVHRLKEEGFLKSVKGHKLIPAESPSQVEKKERLYGNPMSFIVDCVSTMQSRKEIYSLD